MADDDVSQKQPRLILIGMGPGTVASMTTEAISAAKSADYRRYEAYTALSPLLAPKPKKRDLTG